MTNSLAETIDPIAEELLAIVEMAESSLAAGKRPDEAAVAAAMRDFYKAPNPHLDRLYDVRSSMLQKDDRQIQAFVCQWARFCLTGTDAKSLDKFAERAGEELSKWLRGDVGDDSQISSHALALIALMPSDASSWLMVARKAIRARQLSLAALALWRSGREGGSNDGIARLRGEVLFGMGFELAALQQLTLAMENHEAPGRTEILIERVLATLNPRVAFDASRDLAMRFPRTSIFAELAAVYSAEFAPPEEAIARLSAFRSTTSRPARLINALAVAHRRAGDEDKYAELLRSAIRNSTARDQVDYSELHNELLRLKRPKAAREALVYGAALDDVKCREAIIRRAQRSGKKAGAAEPRKHLPMALISQVQRSGGTLLSRLFDNHPQLWAHPHEITIGKPMKWNWVDLSLEDRPREWFRQLFQVRLPTFQATGYVKGDGNPAVESHEFRFSIEKQAELFFQDIEASPPKSTRDILDAYFTSFFRAWSDSSSEESVRWITGFTPRLSMDNLGLTRFWRDYPDGFVISCIRDPYAWFASAARHGAEYRNPEQALDLWRVSTLSALMLADRSPERVHLMTYEDLVSDTEQEMRGLAARLGIEFTDTLLQPTFAGAPTLPNSSFLVEESGVHAHSLTAEERLSEEEREAVSRQVGTLYDDARALIMKRRGS